MFNILPGSRKNKALIQLQHTVDVNIEVEEKYLVKFINNQDKIKKLVNEQLDPLVKRMFLEEIDNV